MDNVTESFNTTLNEMKNSCEEMLRITKSLPESPERQRMIDSLNKQHATLTASLNKKRK